MQKVSGEVAERIAAGGFRNCDLISWKDPEASGRYVVIRAGDGVIAALDQHGNMMEEAWGRDVAIEHFKLLAIDYNDVIIGGTSKVTGYTHVIIKTKKGPVYRAGCRRFTSERESAR